MASRQLQEKLGKISDTAGCRYDIVDIEPNKVEEIMNRRFLTNAMAVAVLVVAIGSMAHVPITYANNDPQLNGPNVVRRNSSGLLALNDSATKIVEGKKIKDDHGADTCAFSVKLTRNPGDPPQAAQQLAFDPDTCQWEVQFGTIEAHNIPGNSGGKTETVPTDPRSSAPANGAADTAPDAEPLASAQGGFVAVTLDPVGLKVNEVTSIGYWEYDANQNRILSHTSECSYWWLSETGWWKHSSNCFEQVSYSDFKTIANAHYKNLAFCNPSAETNVQYQGVTFRGLGAGGKEGWVNALWADGDCSGLLWHNSFLL